MMWSPAEATAASSRWWVVGSSESIVTDMAVDSSRATDICLDLEASDSESAVGESASGGLPRPG